LSNFGKEFPTSISRFDQQEWLDLLPKEMAEYGKEMLKEATGIAVSLVKQSLVPLLKTFSSLVEMIAIPILTFYLLKDGARLWQATANLLPVSVVAAMEPLGIDCLKVLKAYIRGQVLIAFFAGSVVFLGSLALGLPHGAVLALVSAVSEFVPVIGTVIATVPGVLVGLMESPQLALKVLLFYVVLLKVNHNFIYPKVVGDAIRVHPLVILLAILLFGTLFGVIGMLFAVPSMAVGRIWLHHFAERRNLL
jgi:predicted PurR-regulated permease PerM